ncbi:hypothetical protein QTN25_006307 [Entamoeba marina]
MQQSFSVKCYSDNDSLSYIQLDFNYTLFHFMHFSKACYNSVIPTEVVVASYYLTSGTENFGFQKFIQIKANAEEPKDVLSQLLKSFADNMYASDICIVLKNKNGLKHIKSLFEYAKCIIPVNYKFILLDDLLNGIYVFSGLKQPFFQFDDFIVANNHIEMPSCPYHSKNKCSRCIFSEVRKWAYILHAILKDQTSLVVDDFQKINYPKFNKQHNQRPHQQLQTPQQQNILPQLVQQPEQFMLKPIQQPEQFTLKPIQQPPMKRTSNTQPPTLQKLQMKQNVIPPQLTPLFQTPKLVSMPSAQQPAPFQVTTKTNILTEERKKYFNANFPNLCVHFICFEYFYRPQLAKHNNKIAEVSIVL